MRVKFYVIIFVTMLVSLFCFKQTAYANQINVDYGHLNENTIIREPAYLKFSNSPRWSQAQVTTSGGAWVQYHGSKGGFPDQGLARKFPAGWNMWRINMNDSSGRVSIFYPYIGSYKGTEVGAILDVVNSSVDKRGSSRPFYLSFSDNFYYGFYPYATSIAGSKFELDVKLTITYGGTRNSIGRTDNSYLSLGSLNGYQSGSEWFGAYGRDIYVPYLNGVSNIISIPSHVGVGGGYFWDSQWAAHCKIYWEDWIGGQGFAYSGASTAFYNDGSWLAFGSTAYASGWFQLASLSTKPYIPRPSKEVWTYHDGGWYESNGKDVHEGQAIGFILKQRIPTLGDEILQPYNSVTIYDDVDKRIKVSNVYLEGISSGDYSWSVDGNNRVTITLKNTLGNSGWYNRTVTAHIDGNIVRGAAKGQLNNTGHAVIDSLDTPTNQVSVNVTGYQVADPVKNTNKETVLPDQDFNYFLSQPTNVLNHNIWQKYDHLIFRDELPIDYAKFIDAKLYRASTPTGTDVEIPSDQYSVNYDDGLLVVQLNDAGLNRMPMNGEYYNVKVTMHTFATEISGTQFENTAIVNCDISGNKTTNVVKNTIGLVQPSVVKGFVGNVDSNGNMNFDWTQDSTLTYMVMAQGDNSKTTKKLNISDTLNHHFNNVSNVNIQCYVGSKLYLDLQNVQLGKDYSSNSLPETDLSYFVNNNKVVVNYDDNTHLFSIDWYLLYNSDSSDDIGTLANCKILVTFNVNVGANQNYADNYDGESILIPNNATFEQTYVNDSNNSLTSNTVYAKTNPVAPSLHKMIEYHGNVNSTTNVKYDDAFMYRINGNTGNYLDLSQGYELVDDVPTPVTTSDLNVNAIEGTSMSPIKFDTSASDLMKNQVRIKFNTPNCWSSYDFNASYIGEIKAVTSNLTNLQQYEVDNLNITNTIDWRCQDGSSIKSAQATTTVAPIVFVGMDMATMPYGNPTGGVGAISLVQDALVAPSKASDYQANTISFSTIKQPDSSVIDNWQIDGGQTNAKRLNYRTIDVGKFDNDVPKKGTINLQNKNFVISAKQVQPDAHSVYLTTSKDLTDGAVNYDMSDVSTINYDKAESFVAGKIEKVPYLTTHYYDLDSQLNNQRQYMNATKVFYVPVGAKIALNDDKLMSASTKSLTHTSAKTGYNIAFNSMFLMGDWYGNKQLGNITKHIADNQVMGTILPQTILHIPAKLVAGGDDDFVLNNYYRQGFDDVKDALKYYQAIENKAWQTSDFIELSDSTLKTSYPMALKQAQALASSVDKLHASDIILVPTKLSTGVMRFNLPYSALINGRNVIDYSRFDDVYQSLKGAAPITNAKNQIALTDFVDNGTYNMTQSFGKLFGAMRYVTANTPIMSEYGTNFKVVIPLEIYGHRFITKQDGFNSDAQDEINIQPSTSGLQKDDSTVLGEFIDNNEVV